MNLNDDPNAQPAPILPNAGDAGRTFTFQGKPLNRYSYTHKLAFTRLTFEPLSRLEHDTLLIFLLHKTAAEADALRSEEQKAAFRLAANGWAESIGVEREEVQQAIMDCREEVLGDVKAAQSLEPDPKGAPAGNA